MAKNYTVVKGDRLGRIAEANNMTLTELLALNPGIKDPDLIHPGDVIILSADEGEGKESKEGSTQGLLSVPAPDDAQVWKVGENTYLVYVVPGSKPPIYVAWEGLSEENIQSWFGPDQTITYDKVFGSHVAIRPLGVIMAGTDVELANFDENPFVTWVQTMEDQAKTQPWILDDDYQALLMEATLENRDLTDAEIQGTEWWQTHSEAQRSWMKVSHGDPASAEQMIEDNRIMARQMLLDAGVENPSEDLIDFMADQATMGNWSEIYFNSQVAAIADPASGIVRDDGLANLVNEGTGTTQGEEDTVRDLLNEWLGPVYGAWDDEQVAQWAGKVRNDPDAEMSLIQQLQDQRMALFPEHEDRNVTYQSMAAPWRQFMQNQWGQKADEMDPLFQTMLKNNDATLNGQLLIKEGLDRGIGKVVNTMNVAAMRGATGNVRRMV